MTLELDCPLVVLDVESTGVHPLVDRVCQLAFIKIHPDGRRTEWQTYVDPTVPIPEETTKIHGISAETVNGKPTFEALAQRVAAAIARCDFAGYNVDFDLKMLRAEFRRARLVPEQFMNGRVVDVFKIYRRFYPRTLTDAARDYLDRDHAEAHDAMGDVRITLEILTEQLKRHSLPNRVEELHREFQERTQVGALDPDGKLLIRGDDVLLGFGKVVGQSIRKVDAGFLRWMMKGDFTPIVKRAVEEELERRKTDADGY